VARLEAVGREVHVGVLREAPGPDDDVQAERLRATGDFLGDAAETEQPEGRAAEAPGLRILSLVPAAGAQLRDVVGDAPVEREDQAEGELRHGDRVLARAVRDVDATGRRGLDVDGVVAGTRPDDQRQAAGIHHRGGHLGGPDDQDFGVRLAERGDERLVLQRGVVEDFAAGCPQAVEAGMLELVGDEDLHAGCAPIEGSPGSGVRAR